MTPAQRKKWLAERRKGIGGSDAAAAVGRSRWTTPLALYLDKTEGRDQPENSSMRWGTLKEPIIRQEFANVTGRTIEVPHKIIWHPTNNFMLVNVDGISDGSRLLEVKTARSDAGWGPEGSDEVPEEYIFQCQHGMIVTGLKVTDLAVLIGSSDFRIYQIFADSELQELLIEAEREFWRMVENRIPPEPVNAEDVKRRWKLSSGATIQATDEISARVNNLAICKAYIDALEAFEGEQKAQIQRFMAENSNLSDSAGEILATWKNINSSPKFDLETFKAENPDLYAKYLRDSEPSRRFLLKVKGTIPCLPEPLSPLTIDSTATVTTAEKSSDPPLAPPPSNPASKRKSRAA